VALDREFETTRAYADAVSEVATEFDIALVDVWGVLWQAAGMEEQNLSRYLIDGLHLNEAGYAVGGLLFMISLGVGNNLNRCRSCTRNSCP